MANENLAWWLQRLSPLPAEAGPPLFGQRSKVYSAKRAVIPMPVPAGLAPALDPAGEGEETVRARLLAAIAGVLHRYTGQERIPVGSGVPAAAGTGQEAGRTVVALVDVDPERPFADLLSGAAGALAESAGRADVPLAGIVEALGLTEVQNRHPLFAVALRLAALEPPMPAELRHDVTVELAGEPLADEPLAGAPDGPVLHLDYNARTYDPQVIERFGHHLLRLLAAGLAAPESPLHALELLGPDERELVFAWGTGPVAPLDERPVHRLFEEQAAAAPGSEALRFPGIVLTYGELNRRANQLAHYLRGLGAGVGRHVGLCVSAGPDMLLGLLGILKSGAAVVPLVPTFPPARNNMAIEDAALSLVVSETRLRHLLPSDKTTPVCLDEVADELAARPGDDPESGVSGKDLVYILFTSGSTGRPKGVSMEHRSLVNLIEWQRERGGDPAGKRTMQRTSIGFDVSFQEIFSTWCFGGCLVVASDAFRDDVSQLPGFIDEHAVERIFIPPVALHQLAASAATQTYSLASLKQILVAGEQLQISMPVIRLFRQIDCALDNQYGPTETHVVTAHELAPPSTRWPPLPPIGKPVRNIRVYILDRWLEPVPPGVPGEICIGGVAVARGYVNRPELSEQVFLTDPFAPEGGRLYRTGDVGRFLADGTIEFLGRRDSQVKIRGYRIELGEIEALLHQVPGVRHAAVAVHEDEVRGKQLAAYVVTAEPGQPAAATIRSFLAERLPGHMVPAPSAILHLEALPLTPTGKVDHRALPAPAARTAAEEGADVASKSDTERQIAAIWGKVLGLPGVGMEESFLDLGGHSLLGIQIVAQINDLYHVRLPLATLLRGGTVAQVAARVEELAGLRRPEEPGAAPGGPEPQTLELPGGRRILCLHRAEAAYLYLDVFEHKTYDRGIRYPEEGVVFDVGANIGLFTLYALERSPRLEVYAFEPAPPLFEVLRQNTAGRDNVRLWNVALSDRTGTADLTYYPTLSGMSSLYPDPGEERRLFGTILKNLAEEGREGMREVLPYAEELTEHRLQSTVFPCSLRPLSDLIAESGVPRIDLLKIDVQKAELDVLGGIRDDDWGKIRQVVVEVHDLGGQVERVRSLLAGRGYDVRVEQDPLHKDTVVHFVYAT